MMKAPGGFGTLSYKQVFHCLQHLWDCIRYFIFPPLLKMAERMSSHLPVHLSAFWGWNDTQKPSWHFIFSSHDSCPLMQNSRSMIYQVSFSVVTSLKLVLTTLKIYSTFERYLVRCPLIQSGLKNKIFCSCKPSICFFSTFHTYLMNISTTCHIKFRIHVYELPFSGIGGDN